MSYATKEQITKIHVLLNQLQIIDYKKELIYRYSNGRTQSTKELTKEEARELIQNLSKNDPCEPMRRKVFALAYEAGIIWGETAEDKKMNTIKLNQFLLQKGTIKKEVSKLNYQELIKVVSQFEKIIQHQQEGQAAKMTASLLNELNLLSSYKNRNKATQNTL